MVDLEKKLEKVLFFYFKKSDQNNQKMIHYLKTCRFDNTVVERRSVVES